MAATATSTNQVVDAVIGGGGPRGRNGNGFRKNGGGHDDGDDFRYSPARYRIGIWVAIASILMLLTPVPSASIVRMALSNDWTPLVMPKVLWLSTAVLLISSVTIEVSKRSLKRAKNSQYGLWLMLTAILGVVFVGSQYAAWRNLARQGVY